MAKIINGDKYRNAPPRVVARALAAEREISPEGCWLWSGRLSRDGYGSITYGTRKGGGRQFVLYVHRLVYMHLKGDPGDEMQIDHLCHDPKECTARDDCPHRRCYNPAHLLAVTALQNRRRCGAPTRRKPPRTHCDAGHEYTEANTRWHEGTRICRKCDSLRNTARVKALRRATRKPCQDCGADMADRPIRAVYCAGCAQRRDIEKQRRYREGTGAGRSRARTEERRQGRCCETCGRDISHRRTNARNCEECAEEKGRIEGRERARNRWRLQNWGTASDDGRAA